MLSPEHRTGLKIEFRLGGSPSNEREMAMSKRLFHHGGSQTWFSNPSHSTKLSDSRRREGTRLSQCVHQYFRSRLAASSLTDRSTHAPRRKHKHINICDPRSKDGPQGHGARARAAGVLSLTGFRLTRCVRANALQLGLIFAVSLRNVITFVLREDAEPACV
jgi:hypothetical protein